MGLSANDRFALIMFGLTLGVGLIGWLIRRVINGIDTLNSSLNRLTERVARLEGPAMPRGPASPRRPKR